MVLDPLSAFSLACNLLQLVEVGSKVLSKAAEYHNSTHGVLSEQQDLQNVLQSTLPPLDQAQLCENFNQFLDTLKSRDRHTSLDAFRMGIKAMWHRERIEGM